MMTLQPLTRADFNDWNPLWQAYLVFYKTTLSDVVTKTSFERLTDDAEPMGGFLARDASRNAVGMVNWIDHRTNWSLGNKCYLQDLYVSEAGRGLGTGRALIDAVGVAAKARGCANIYWQTHETNETAMLLYDRMAKKSGFLVYEMGVNS